MRWFAFLWFWLAGACNDNFKFKTVVLSNGTRLCCKVFHEIESTNLRCSDGRFMGRVTNFEVHGVCNPSMSEVK